MVPFGKWVSKTSESIAQKAILDAIADAEIDRSAIGEAFCGTSYGGPLAGQRALRDLGMTGMAITNVENACSSGASGVREAVSAVESGRAEIALVFGVEKLTKFGGGTLPLEATDIDVSQGMVMPASYAMRAQRYLMKYGARPEHLAMVTVKARKMAADNPYAQFRSPVTVEQVLQARMIADPLTLLMCCPTGDGAAAVVIANSRRARQLSRRSIRIKASVAQSGKFETGAHDISQSELTMRTVALAYEQASVGPNDINVAEVHDAFTIAELMYYEALGFCEEGAASSLVESGQTTIGGRIPVNPSGGLLCRGHPVGATGIAQIIECVWQLRGDAKARQVEGCKIALTHCTGGGVSGLDHGACLIHVLGR